MKKDEENGARNEYVDENMDRWRKRCSGTKERRDREEETRTDSERLALGFAYAREVERARAFVALDAKAQVHRTLEQMYLFHHNELHT